jgi:hypothetical protein
MRRFTTALVFVVLLLSAGAAAALTIDPNPVNQTRDSTLDADVALLSHVGDTMTFQLSVTTGAITQIDISMLFDDLQNPTSMSFVTSAGTHLGTGDMAMTAIAAVSEAQFIVIGTVGAGQTSDEFWVQFDAGIREGWEGAITFDTGIAQDSVYATVIPEPGTSLLMGGALAGLALMRRRRPA